eukprot:TRINITY_DN17243_c0_g1_i1.p1 TRINITY_DN17243_c0_g1~~TRINITY_DN17243_c0_g1_i1.p1  ORF type:complete len:315 (-),score=82.14 TRINITY_DN17243_c0_g1_i1:23-967(-)
MEKLTVAELREELKKKGLKTSGLKADLIKRLREEGDDEGEEEVQPETKSERKVKKSKKVEKEEEEEEGTESNNNDGKEEQAEEGDMMNLKDLITDPGWRGVLEDEFKKKYFLKIQSFLQSEKKAGKVIFPPTQDIFRAFNDTPFDQVKVVIIGQDPYFRPGQAHGLCFSVEKGVKVPPSLGTLYRELEATFPGFVKPKHGNLQEWAKRGVLMLNATMTVEDGTPNSHAKCGWLEFTDAVIRILNEKKEKLVFLLWGGFAQKIGSQVDGDRHHILKSPHPSPQAGGGFKGCACFTKANELLKADGLKPIDWKISP